MDPFKIPPPLVVNNFGFCVDHGDEFCPQCCCDHRQTNNYQIGDRLQEFSDISGYDVDDRDPINVYVHGATAVKKKKDYIGKCSVHNKVDCGTCFNWAGLIINEAKAGEAQGKWMKKREKYYRTQDD
ncbi:hypothetical protein B0H34DRAFT_661959 [Crassisporium funariophilum]|nr:hypothetical protein B0H34DRAFT_661959 [Crassisporium funariophilum]